MTSVRSTSAPAANHSLHVFRSRCGSAAFRPTPAAAHSRAASHSLGFLVAMLAVVLTVSHARAEGSDDSWWNGFTRPGANGDVHASILFDGDLVIAGNFSVVGERFANRIARWDGTNWHAMGEGMNQPVRALAVHDGELYAGGDFAFADGQTVWYVARWDGANWQPLGSGMQRQVYALASYGGRLIAGGDFDLAGGVEAHKIAAWDGTSWSDLDVAFDGPIFDFV